MAEEQQTESIGARLHKARLKKKATIEQVYKDIKVHPKILTALEEDRYDEFLNPTYIKAFLKSYCRYLELDANKILADYDGLKKEPAKTTLNITREEKSKIAPAINWGINWTEYANLTKKWFTPVIAGILAVFLILLLTALSSKAIKKVKAIKLLKTKTASIAQTPAEPRIFKSLSIPQAQPLTLIVKTKGDVWLEVKSDNKTQFKSTMKKGSVETYKANEKFQLWTGKGEFLSLALNGNDLGSPGNGVFRKIILTREGLSVEKK